MCYSLFFCFLIWPRDRKVRFPPPSGHFHVSENGAGIQKNRALYLVLFLLCYFGCNSDGNHAQNRREAMQKDDLLEISLSNHPVPSAVTIL